MVLDYKSGHVHYVHGVRVCSVLGARYLERPAKCLRFWCHFKYLLGNIPRELQSDILQMYGCSLCNSIHVSRLLLCIWIALLLRIPYFVVSLLDTLPCYEYWDRAHVCYLQCRRCNKTWPHGIRADPWSFITCRSSDHNHNPDYLFGFPFRYAEFTAGSSQLLPLCHRYNCYAIPEQHDLLPRSVGLGYTARPIPQERVLQPLLLPWIVPLLLQG